MMDSQKKSCFHWFNCSLNTLFLGALLESHPWSCSLECCTFQSRGFARRVRECKSGEEPQLSTSIGNSPVKLVRFIIFPEVLVCAVNFPNFMHICDLLLELIMMEKSIKMHPLGTETRKNKKSLLLGKKKSPSYLSQYHSILAPISRIFKAWSWQ